jgi:uncharacterized Fe-S center protein
LGKSQIIYKKNVDLSKDEIKEFFEGKYIEGSPVYIKIHFGEPGNVTALNVTTVKPYIDALKELGFETILWDCPVFYGGPRATKAGYEEVIKDKGFLELSSCEVCDDYVTITLDDGHKVEVAELVSKAKNLLTLTHVKGHPAAGFGASIKNIGIGAVSPKSKAFVHEIEAEGDEFGFSDERIGQVVAATYKEMPQNNLFVNIIRDVTQFCDCMPDPGQIIAPDLGVLVSDNIVAIDQASYDLLIDNAGHNIFVEHNKKDPKPQIDFTSQYSGLTTEYELV